MSKHTFTDKQKEVVFGRANHQCEYCKYPAEFSHDKFQMEHIVPLVKGGTHNLKNVALSCYSCNLSKWVHTEWKDPETSKIVKLFHPRLDDWDDHFKWSDDLTEIIGLTPSGRATILLLMINRSGLVNARKALISHGVHPAQNKIT